MKAYRTTASDRAAAKLRVRAHEAMDEWRGQRRAEGKATDIPDPIECQPSYLSRRLRGILSGYHINVHGGDEVLMKAAAKIFQITGFGNDIRACLAKIEALPRKTRHKYAKQAVHRSMMYGIETRSAAAAQRLRDAEAIHAAAEGQRLRRLMGEA